jgi:hypothetical protein
MVLQKSELLLADSNYKRGEKLDYELLFLAAFIRFWFVLRVILVI